jgi:hypothetical protein
MIVIMMLKLGVEKSVEWESAKETEVLIEYLPPAPLEPPQTPLALT